MYHSYMHYDSAMCHTLALSQLMDFSNSPGRKVSPADQKRLRTGHPPIGNGEYITGICIASLRLLDYGIVFFRYRVTKTSRRVLIMDCRQTLVVTLTLTCLKKNRKGWTSVLMSLPVLAFQVSTNHPRVRHSLMTSSVLPAETQPISLGGLYYKRPRTSNNPVGICSLPGIYYLRRAGQYELYERTEWPRHKQSPVG